MNKLNVKRLSLWVAAACVGFAMAVPAWAADSNANGAAGSNTSSGSNAGSGSNSNGGSNTGGSNTGSGSNTGGGNAGTQPAIQPSTTQPTADPKQNEYKTQNAILNYLTGENFTLAVQKNQNTATMIQWDDLLGLLRPMAPGVTLQAQAREFLGIDNGSRQSYLGSLNAGFMSSGLRLQLGAHYHSTFFYDMLTNGWAPKERSHTTGYAVTLGAGYPVQGVLLSVQFSYLHAKGDINGPDQVGLDGSDPIYSIGTFTLKQDNLRFNLGLSKNFPLSFSQVITPYVAFQMERNSVDATQETVSSYYRATNKINYVPLTIKFDKQHVMSKSAMAGLLYQVSDAFTTPGLALGLDYTIAYRFGDKPRYTYSTPDIHYLSKDKAGSSSYVDCRKSCSFKNPDSGLMQRFGFQLGYQWGPVFVGSHLNIYYTTTPDEQPGVLNTEYSLLLSGSF